MSHRTLRRIAGVAVIAALALAWAAFLRPAALGGPASYVFVTGVSMQPTLETGDLVVLQRAAGYQPGDIVAFSIPDGEPGAGALVIHRIVGGSAETGFVMRGDNKPRPDEWQPVPDQIAGRLWLRLPGAGTAIAFVRQPSVFAPLMAGLVVFFILLGGSDRRQEPIPASVPDHG